MNTVVALVAWITINGFPYEQVETCELAQERAAQLQQKMPELSVRAKCELAQPDDPNPIDYYGLPTDPKADSRGPRTDF